MALRQSPLSNFPYGSRKRYLANNPVPTDFPNSPKFAVSTSARLLACHIVSRYNFPDTYIYGDFSDVLQQPTAFLSQAVAGPHVYRSHL